MNSALYNPVATRFLWKEYRTLRGFWLAAFVIAAVLQALGVVFSPPSADPVAPLFGIALAAAALYAVGVAATSFSMEHEEETYGFLSSLPARWMPLLAGKLSFAASSALALAVALQLTGFVIAGMRTPGRGDYLELLATFGFAIFELLAWGTLFSLLLRQPLLAALLAIGAESLALTWAVNAFAEGNMPAMVLASYAAVLPVRLAVAACVAIVCVLVARRWLVLDRTSGQVNAEAAIPPRTSPSNIGASLRAIVTTIRRSAWRPPSPAFSHLLWQTWRQAWKPMLLMSILVPLVCYSIVLISGLGELAKKLRDSQFAFMPFAFALFAMSLYWSVVFQADQRNRKYRFLAEHAVWPRYVWLSRILVWSLPVVVALTVATCLTASGIYDVLALWRRHIESIFRQQHDGWWGVRLMADEWKSIDYTTRGVLFGLWGMLLGFAVGQATSLFFRRALVAGFAALVITLPLLGWGVAVWNWELAPTEFLLPIVLGLVAASWLRAPDWLLDRHRFIGWLIVLSALALPLAFIASRLPAIRAIPDGIQRQAVWQIQESIGSRFMEPIDPYMPFDAGQVVAEWVDRSNAQITKEQWAIGDRLVRLSEMVTFPERGFLPDLPSARDQEKYQRKKVDMNRTVLAEAAKIGREDFWFDVSDASYDRLDTLVYLLRDAGNVALLDRDLDQSLDYYLASLSILERLWSSRSTATVPVSDTRQQIHTSLVDWANAKGQTKARIQRLIVELDTIYPPVTELQPAVQSIDSLSSWTPPPQIVATYESLRNILLGEEPSHLLGKEARPEDYVAVIANELPFERQRALRILDLLTINEVAQWRDVLWRTNQQLLQDWAKNTIKARGEGGIENMGQSLRSKIQRGYSLSFGRGDNYTVVRNYPPYSWLRTTTLLRMELERRRSFGDWLASIVDKQISAWGLRQQLALIAYQREHGEYPPELAALVPDYLPSVPIDPYAGRPFEYRPQGVPLWFRDYSRRLEPNTPFFYSVGPGNEHLEIVMRYDAIDPAAVEGSFNYEVRHETYILSGDTPNWPLARPLVFALPKPAGASAAVESADVETDVKRDAAPTDTAEDIQP